MKKKRTESLLFKSTIWLLLLWVTISIISISWNFYAVKKHTREVVLNVAHAYLEKDRSFRLWGASHGGAYVPITVSTPANPFLKHISERDITSPSGRELTLMNPAYMMRQMMSIFNKQSRATEHLTSLKPINPINEPDPWERSVLLSFEKELVESVTEFRLYKGTEHLRMMMPFITKKACLKCHAQQGYKVGDIRGGISVSIPMQPYYDLEIISKKPSIITLLILFLCGFIGILFSSLKIRSYMRHHFSMEESVRKQNEFINTIINSLSHPFYVVDVDSYEIILANSTAIEHGDGSAATCYALGHNRDSPCSGKEHPCPMRQVKKDKKMVTVEHIHFDKDGMPVNMEIQCFPIFDENNNVIRVIEYCYDITKRKRAENEKLQLIERLQESQKLEAIGTLAGGIAHDFNNLLSVIMGSAQLAKLNIQSGTNIKEENIDQIFAAGKRASELVKQILTFSRKSADNTHPLSPHLIIKEALKMIRSTLPTSITIQYDIDSACGMIEADSTKIHQIMVNLCTNGMQAMESVKGILRIRLYRENITENLIPESEISAGPFIVLSVSDTGHGMDKKTVQRIFEPYYTTKEVDKGTGLGLSTVYGIIKELKGFIQVESEPKIGTTIRVYIPALPIDFSDLKVEQQEAPIPLGTERILFVDDEGDLVKIQKKTLTSLGYQVTSTTDSEDALRRFLESPDNFDILITDMTMPGMTGAELAQKILAIKPGFPIILCTGFSKIVDEEKAKSFGITEYIRKPIIIRELAIAIRRALKKDDV